MKRLAVLSLMAPLAVLATPGPTQAAELCQGLAPTIVGTPGSDVAGTPGDDVIATEGADTVEAGAGNDRICVTGQEDPNQLWVKVLAGHGDDIVDTTAYGSIVMTELGPGADAFVGGPGEDDVDNRDADGFSDTIATGGGRDRVIAGQPGQPLVDVLDLGTGLDYLKLRGLAGPGSIDAGADRDEIVMNDRTRADWRIDNRKQVLAVGDTSMPMLSVESFDLGDLRWGSVRFVGGPGEETLDLWKSPPAKPDGAVLVDMGAGDDRFIPGPAQRLDRHRGRPGPPDPGQRQRRPGRGSGPDRRRPRGQGHLVDGCHPRGIRPQHGPHGPRVPGRRRPRLPCHGVRRLRRRRRAARPVGLPVQWLAALAGAHRLRRGR